jgi:DNA-binding beta-propeller fold protein YncE
VTELNATTGNPIRIVTGSRYGFTYPAAVAADGTHVWVANDFFAGGGGSVTELNATTGNPIQVLTGPRYQFIQPVAIVTDSTHVWVASSAGNSVTEFPASSQ